jgi:hypothetical protein
MAMLPLCEISATPRSTGLQPNRYGHRSNQRQVAGRLNQALFQFPALLAHFGKTGSVTDTAPCPRLRQAPYNINGRLAVDADMGSVRDPGQILDTRVTIESTHGFPRGVDRPDFALVTHFHRPPYRHFGNGATSERNAAWRKKTGQFV